MRSGFRSCGLVAAWILGLSLLLSAAGAGATVESEMAFHRGVVAYGEERFDDARREFERVLAADAEDATALHYLGLIAQAQDDLDGAISLYERGLRIDPEDSDLLFDLGTALLEAGRVERARRAFARVISAQPDHAQAHLFAGIAAYRAGAHAEATPHLNRAVELDASLRLQASYYRGLSAIKLDDLAGAEGAFTEVEEQSPQSALARSAANLRGGLRPGADERRWSLSASAGLEYDSNPTLAGLGVNREDDLRGVYRLRGDVRLYQGENASVSAGYDGYLSTHFDATEVDVQSHVVHASAGVDLDPLRFSVRYDYGYTFIDLDRKFRDIHRVTPSLAIREGELGVLQVFYQYQLLNLLQPSFSPVLNRDGTQHSAGFNQFFMLPKPFRYLRVGGLGDFFRADGDEFDYDGWEASIGGAMDLPGGIELNAIYRFGQRAYRNRSSFAPFVKRDDTTQRLSLEAARSLGDHWEISAAGQMTLNQSDVDVFNYNRFVAGIYLTYRF